MYWIYGGLNGDDFYTGEQDSYPSESYTKRYYNFKRDPLYYFSKITEIATIEKQTDKAILFKIYNDLYWIPKKIIKIIDHDIYIHTEIGSKIISTRKKLNGRKTNN